MHSPASSTDPTPPPLEPRAASRLWNVGTLTYTAPALFILFFWLLFGDFALSMRERSADPVVQLLVKKHNASSTYQSYLLAVLPSAIALFLGPVLSYKSDRHRGRWGRRIPYLLIPTPIAAAAMVGLAFSPMLGAWTHQRTGWGTPDGCVLGWFAFFYMAFEFGSLTALILFGALVNDVVPRPLLGRFFGCFRAVSLGAGIIFNRWLLSWAETHFFQIFVAIALIFGIGFTLMCLMVKEGQYPPPPDPRAIGDARGLGFFGAARTYFRECFASGYYRLIFIAMLIASLTFMPFNRFSIPYYKSLGMETKDYGVIIANSYLISLLIAYPLGSLVDRFHSLRIGLGALFLYAVAVTYGTFFVHDARTFGIALYAHTVLSGTYFTATASLGQALFPKLKFGQFASAAGIVGNLGSIGVGMLIGPALDLTGNNYRLTFIMGLVLCLTSIVLLFLVYRQFMALGGPTHYQAPDNDGTLPHGLEVIPLKNVADPTTTLPGTESTPNK